MWAGAPRAIIIFLPWKAPDPENNAKQKRKKKEMINDRKWNNVTPGSSNLRICLFSVFMTRSFPRRAREIGNMPTIQSLAFALHILPVRCRTSENDGHLCILPTPRYSFQWATGATGIGLRNTSYQKTPISKFMYETFFFCYLRLCFAYRSAFHMQWENTKATRGIKNVVFFSERK